MVERRVPLPKLLTFADVLAQVGDVPPERIRLSPVPGTATADDTLKRENKGCELVYGTLVEKASRFSEEYLGSLLSVRIYNFVFEHNLGIVVGSQNYTRLGENLVRHPDIIFVSWDSTDDPEQLAGEGHAFLEVTPDLVVEVLSPGNTAKEMALKLTEYGKAGVKLAWYIDPKQKTVTVYPRGKERGKKVLKEGDTLDGGRVLPGFEVPIAEIFKKRTPRKKGKKK